MRFWIYEHFSKKRARLHTSECRYCNDGQGVGGDQTNDDDKWHGPFETYGEAETAMFALGHKDSRACGVCKPATATAVSEPSPIPAAAATAATPVQKTTPAPKEAPRKSTAKDTGRVSQVIGDYGACGPGDTWPEHERYR